MINRETLEDAAENYSQKYSQKVGRKYGFMDGAEWQAERMYSEEDMMFAYEQGARLALISQSSLALQKGEFPTPKEWFEQFKKQNNEQ
jgi:hypothetical protein